MSEFVKCDCGLKIPIMRKAIFYGPLTPQEELLARAKLWAKPSPFSRAEPVAAELIQELIDALNSGLRGEK